MMKSILLFSLPCIGASAFAQDSTVSPGATAETADVTKARAAVIEGERNISKLAAMLTTPGAANQLFYFPTHDRPATPADWGRKYEEVSFNAADGTKLHGWFMPATGKLPLGTIVFSHGNAGSVGHHLGFAVWFAESGYNVLMYDYRGFGASEGSIDRAGIVTDVSAAIDYARSRKDVDSTRIVSYGHSMGGAKSIAALATQPEDGVRAIIVDGGFASYKAMAKRIGGQLAEGMVTDEFAPQDLVAKLAPVPLLIVHGTEDEMVPYSQGFSLFKSAGHPKTLFKVEGGRHGDSLWRNQHEYRAKTLAWLADVMPPAAG